MEERAVLHSDLNSFYASVEMMLDPSLRGKAVAVCGSTEDRHGIVLAKSDLAKKAGVKTGMVNWEARQLCRNLIIVPPQYDQYLKYSKLTQSIYQRYTDMIEPFGMDECWLDVTGSRAMCGDALTIAESIRKSIREELGLTVSIGVSYNKIFAKLGSDMKKPDAITQIRREEVRDKIWPLDCSEMIYCGRATTAKLAKYGIHTIGQVAETDPAFLKHLLGVNGLALWRFANGADTSRVMHKDFVSPVKSIGHGITCTADLDGEEEVWRVILELSQDIGHRLRVHELPVLTELSGTGVELLAEFTKGISDANGDIGKMSDVIGEILPKALDAVMEYVPELLEVIASIVGSLGQAIIDNLPVIVESASQIILSILNGLIAGLPQITNGALQLVLALVSGILSNLPMLIETAAQVIVTIATGLATALPTLIPTLVEVVVQMCQTLVDNLPLILDAALQLITGLAQGILEALPVVIEALPQIIDGIVTFFLDSIPQIIDTGIQLLTSLVEALPQIITAIVAAIPKIIDNIISAVLSAIPQIIQAGIDLLIALVRALPQIITTIVQAIPQIISGIVNALIGNIDKIILAGVQLFVALIENLPTIIVEIVKAVPQIIAGIVSAFGSLMYKIVEIGGNIVKGLWQGIQQLASWLWDKVSGWISSIWDGICDFFGIHSPSDEMAWVGEMLVKGLAGSIDRNGGEAVKAAEAMSADINDVMHGLAADMSTALPTSFSVDGSVTANGVNGISAVAGQTVINIYPQTLDEATIDYLFVRFNARLGAAI